MRRVRFFVLPVFVLACLVASGQAVSGSGPHAPAEVRLADSFVALPGPWKFAPGDSPVVDGNLLWASPKFDDATWADMDLHPKAGDRDPGYGNASYLTGWSARGYPHLAGFAWYRLRIHVASTSAPLWIKMPDHTDDSYQVYANGKYVGEFGEFTPSGVTAYRSRPKAFPLPAPDEHGDVLLAIRFYMEPWVLFTGTTGDSGGMHQTPLVGLQSQMESIRAQEVTGRILNVLSPIFVSFLMLIAAGGAFWIWLLDRPHRTYLWLTFALVLSAAPVATLTVGMFTYAYTQGVANIFTLSLEALSLVFWILFWRRWFDLPRGRWPDVLLVVFTAVLIVTGIFIRSSLSFPPRIILLLFEVRAGCNAAMGVLLAVALFQGARKDRIGALLALPPIILLTISLFSIELIAWFRIRTAFFPFGVEIGVKEVALVLLILVTGALVARRFIGSQVSQRMERQTIDQELEQASELQQRVLIPEAVTSAHFTVENAYWPARTVGGDFFR
jgi:hypothetical protein